MKVRPTTSELKQGRNLYYKAAVMNISQ